MPVTVRQEWGNAGVVMVAKWCLSRGEKVTIIVPAGSSAAELSTHFTGDELTHVTFSPADAVQPRASSSL